MNSTSRVGALLLAASPDGRGCDLSRDLDLHVHERRELTIESLQSIRAARRLRRELRSASARGQPIHSLRVREHEARVARRVGVWRLRYGCTLRSGLQTAVSVMRSLRFGGSGCGVPGVGLPPLIGFPPPCAVTTSAEATRNIIRPPAHTARLIRPRFPAQQSDRA